MEAMSNQLSTPKELYIVGPTASGKSTLAMDVALEMNGEIVCADSQTLRKHLDIGTAKPPISDQLKVPHHMLDSIEPFNDYSVAEFQAAAKKIINEIEQRGRLPVIVGGSGMYIDSLYFDYTINEHKPNYAKQELETFSVTELQEIIASHNWPMPKNENNPRHLIGVILRGGENHIDRDTVSLSEKFIIGLLPNDNVLKQRIAKRVDDMFDQGFVDEVKQLIKRYGPLPERMDAIGYPLVASYIDGDLSLKDVKERFVRGHWQYARKQKAWFKRNPHVIWFEEKNEALQYVKESLNKN